MADRASLLPTERDPTDREEVIMVDDRVVACDGGDGPLGHPRVFLRIVDRDAVCPYCSRSYVLRAGARHRDGH